MTSNDTGCARDNSSVQISYCFTDPEMTEVSDQVRMESQPSPRVPGSRGPILRHYPPSSNPGRVLTAAGGGTGLATGAGSKALSSPHRHSTPGPSLPSLDTSVQGQRLSTKPPTTGAVAACYVEAQCHRLGPSCYLPQPLEASALVMENTHISLLTRASISRNYCDILQFRHLVVALLTLSKAAAN